MDTSIITKADQFDEACLSFSERSYTTPTSAKLVSFMYKNQVLLVQTPVLTCPLGFRPFDTKNDRQTLLVNVDASMIEVFEKIDNAIMTNIMEQSPVWFEKTFTSVDILRELFNGTVKYKKTYPANISIRLKFKEDNPLFGFFDKDQQEIYIRNVSDIMSILPRKTSVRLLLSATSIWFVGGRCGCSWDCVQLQVCDTPRVNNIHQFMFIEEDNNEEQKV